MRIRVDAGSDIRIALADPGFGGGRTGIKSPSAGVTPPPGGYTPLPTPATTGSYYLGGTANDNIYLQDSADFLFQGQFTIEWWHKQSLLGSYPRIFAIGNYPTTSIGVSLEGTFYFWANGAGTAMGGCGNVGEWNHHAVCRDSNGTISHYLNGNYQGGFSRTGAIGSSSIPFRIGNELTTSEGAAFQGLITNFHVVNGHAKYLTSFTPATGPTPAMAGTVLLLWAKDVNDWTVDGSGSGRSVTLNSVNFSPDKPFA